MMEQDPIVEDLHKTRRALLDQYQGSFEAYFAALLAQQKQHPDAYVTLAPRSAQVPPHAHQAKR